MNKVEERVMLKMIATPYEMRKPTVSPPRRQKSMAEMLCGVQPMTGPAGLVLTMRARYADPYATRYDRAMKGI